MMIFYGLSSSKIDHYFWLRRSRSLIRMFSSMIYPISPEWIDLYSCLIELTPAILPFLCSFVLQPLFPPDLHSVFGATETFDWLFFLSFAGVLIKPSLVAPATFCTILVEATSTVADWVWGIPAILPNAVLSLEVVSLGEHAESHILYHIVLELLCDFSDCYIFDLVPSS